MTAAVAASTEKPFVLLSGQNDKKKTIPNPFAHKIDYGIQFIYGYVGLVLLYYSPFAYSNS